MRRFKSFVLPAVLITGIADRGKAVGRHEGQVVFVEGAVPGDIVDVWVQKKKSGFMEGKVERFVKYADDRVTPFCEHFGLCGGCKWQYLSYDAQLRFKQETVENALLRIGKVEVESFLPILGAPQPTHYRNKLEFTFSDKKWLTREEIDAGLDVVRRGVGFHLPGHFDKVVDVNECHLQAEPSNAIRNAVRQFAYDKDYSFYNIKTNEGFFRNLIVRTASTGQLMVTVSFGEDIPDAIQDTMSFLQRSFSIDALFYVVNTKHNDTIFDQDIILFSGLPYIEEKLGEVRFHVGPKSFFQTNTRQAEALYAVTKEFAGLTGQERVYDLYTGLGSIACYIAADAKEVIGIEEIEPAVIDARANAALNGFGHLHFYAGDVKQLLTRDLIDKHGPPDVIITDPPRAGMHEKVVETLLQLNAPTIVYVSCNPATQARDIQLMSGQYRTVKSRAVDMFPQTHHIENVVLLKRITA